MQNNCITDLLNIQGVKVKDIKNNEFKRCVSTLREWHEYISNYFKYNYSNGPTEGKNNLIKVIKRISFGFRNFNNFRNRILILNLK